MFFFTTAHRFYAPQLWLLLFPRIFPRNTDPVVTNVGKCWTDKGSGASPRPAYSNSNLLYLLSHRKFDTKFFTIVKSKKIFKILMPTKQANTRSHIQKNMHTHLQATLWLCTEEPYEISYVRGNPHGPYGVSATCSSGEQFDVSVRMWLEKRGEMRWNVCTGSPWRLRLQPIHHIFFIIHL